jgi:hypothetical protein
MDNNQNKPGVVKISKVERRGDGGFELTGADGRQLTLENTFAPQLSGATDGYVIIESNGTKRWQSTIDYEAAQKPAATQNQPANVADAHANDQDVILDKDVKPESQRKAR